MDNHPNLLMDDFNVHMILTKRHPTSQERAGVQYDISNTTLLASRNAPTSFIPYVPQECK